MKTKNRNWLFLFLIMGVILILVYGCPGSDEDNNTTSITDKDGNVYTSVTIGTQTWMVENLKTTKLNDGTAIPNVTDNTAWISLTTPGYCWYNNDVVNKTPYGALYNWYAVNTGKLCPTGWHVPTDAEWTSLITFLGGEDVADGKLKETGTTHWNDPNAGATNETNFTALPGGGRNYFQGTFYDIGRIGNWWSATESDATSAWSRNLYYNNSSVIRLSVSKRYGLSVRCLKDN